MVQKVQFKKVKGSILLEQLVTNAFAQCGKTFVFQQRSVGIEKNQHVGLSGLLKKKYASTYMYTMHYIGLWVVAVNLCFGYTFLSLKLCSLVKLSTWKMCLYD